MKPLAKYTLASSGGLGIAAQVKSIYFWVADNYLTEPWQAFPVDDALLIVSLFVIPLFTLAFPASDRTPRRPNP